MSELTERDLEQVTGGVVAGESMDDKHKDMGGGSTVKPASRYPGGSSWVGSKI
jgi:bacteriocin-like protein